MRAVLAAAVAEICDADWDGGSDCDDGCVGGLGSGGVREGEGGGWGSGGWCASGNGRAPSREAKCASGGGGESRSAARTKQARLSFFMAGIATGTAPTAFIAVPTLVVQPEVDKCLKAAVK